MPPQCGRTVDVDVVSEVVVVVVVVVLVKVDVRDGVLPQLHWAN